MKHGFIKVGAGRIKTSVADTKANTAEILKSVNDANAKGVKLLALPELCITGASCGNLFYSDTLLNSVKDCLEAILQETAQMDITVVLGAPLAFEGKLFDCAVVINSGNILGIVPCEKHSDIFSNDTLSVDCVTLLGTTVPFSSDIIFRHTNLDNFSFCVAIGDDAYISCAAAINVNIAASGETVGKAEYRRVTAKTASYKNISGYIYTSCGEGESTTDEVFSGHLIISEKGKVLCESNPFDENMLIVSEIDVNLLSSERIKNHNIYCDSTVPVYFYCKEEETSITRHITENPFIPESKDKLKERCETILNIQAAGLAKRIEHTHSKSVVIGISGGLDSTLALLVCAKAMDKLNRPLTDIIAVTMPCFGTTKRTKSNAVTLCEELGVTFMEVNITAAVRQHFADIGHDESITDVTYENSQARERTQVLMDIAGRFSGFVVGTGDISELALGWATYNGDHMSMYGVNGGVPKTLIRHIVKHEAEKSRSPLSKVLLDILDTPVSPELLPVNDNGEMTQKTEDLVGPYELHDFFLYYICRYGFSPAKVYRLALIALSHKYDEETIKKWLKNFVRRFFSQQFKRSCLPDGPKVGSVSLSPRGDWKMPSDAVSAVWLAETELL